MVVVKLMGGLGNQMFQYAFGKYLAEKHQTELKLDLSFLLDRNVKTKNHVFRNYDLDIFNLQAAFVRADELKGLVNYVDNKYVNKVITKLAGKRRSHIIETDMSFMPTAFNSDNGVYLEGYWQSERYFKPIKELVRSEFTIKDNFPENVKQLAKEIADKNAICVNIRRGDFLNSGTHGVCSPEYYYKAEKVIASTVPDGTIYVFSDDIDWCIANLKFKLPVFFVKHDYAGPKFEWYLYLMIICKHFIIANSSFAWWAAYLAENQSKVVIAPAKWVQDDSLYNVDIYPKDWLTVSG